MSNFMQVAQHPESGEMQTAEWVDDFFGRHQYGVRFQDGKVFRESDIQQPPRNLVVMTYGETYEVHARTENYEEYVMRIVAKDYDQAEKAAKALCDALDLIFMGMGEED